MSSATNIEALLTADRVEDPQYATRLVDGLLRAADQSGASDLHFQPTSNGLQLKWRVDGVLHEIGSVPDEVASNVVVRLKVLARLLTYQTQVPQEGRISLEDDSLDVRISTFPTVFGEKAVARLLPTSETSLARIGDLGLPPEVRDAVAAALMQTSGAILIVGPAGSGKTTTAYACLREILACSNLQRSIASVEDPVEKVIDQVAQSEVAESVGFDLTSGLRSLVRQDPDVIFVGEIRDPKTAEIAFQAALTGQLVVSTFHAPDAFAAISRLIDMGIPPYVLRSAINCVVGQQLVRRLCSCASDSQEGKGDSNDTGSNLGIEIKKWRTATGCERCRQSGYSSRQIVAELLDLSNPEVAAQIRSDADAHQLRSFSKGKGIMSLREQAIELVKDGITSPAEIIRVFGIAASSEVRDRS